MVHYGYVGLQAIKQKDCSLSKPVVELLKR